MKKLATIALLATSSFIPAFGQGTLVKGKFVFATLPAPPGTQARNNVLFVHAINDVGTIVGFVENGVPIGTLPIVGFQRSLMDPSLSFRTPLPTESSQPLTASTTLALLSESTTMLPPTTTPVSFIAMETIKAMISRACPRVPGLTSKASTTLACSAVMYRDQKDISLTHSWMTMAK